MSEQIKVKLCVNAADAVRMGKTQSGDFEIAVTEAGLATLTPEERGALGPYIVGTFQRGTIAAPATNPTPTWEAFVEGFRARLAKLAADAAEERARIEDEAAKAIERIVVMRPEDLVATETWSGSRVCVPFYVSAEASPLVKSDARVAALYTDAEGLASSRNLVREEEQKRRKAEEAAAKERTEREAAENERRYADACAAFIAHNGTPSQIARREEGLLPAEELEDAIRAHLFAPLEGFARYEKLTKDDVEHTETCMGPEMKFAVGDADDASPEVYERFVKIRQAFPSIGPTIGRTCVLREHRATCLADGCGDSPSVYSYSALVTIEWHGHSFSREYALDS